MSLEAEIIKGLQQQFQFRKTKGSWLQEGTCPQCGKREAYCAAKDPKVVKCSRADNCGWSDTVRNLLPDVFEDWSKRFAPTPENPTATADAYLLNDRMLDLQYLRGSYTQELYRDSESGAVSATVRFRVGETFWERLIDRVGRFKAKANFGYGGTYKGHVWTPPRYTIEDYAKADEILFAEGIFDAVALCQVRKMAASVMSTTNWPEKFLADLRVELERIGRTTRPKLLFAYDVGDAGVGASRKHVKQARAEGWEAEALQVKPDGEGTKKDWNDLLKEHLDWDGDPEKSPMGAKAFEEYLYNGRLTLAETAHQKARLIADRKLWHSFDFRHGNRLYWCKVRYTKDEDGDETRHLDVEEIANCNFRVLYRERDEIGDETNYFLQVDFPGRRPRAKARFSSNALSDSSGFKKRLFAFAGTWSGTGEQLDRIVKNQPGLDKVVTPIKFTGYSAEHQAWVLGDLAVRGGRVFKINADKYFDFGKQAVKLRSDDRLLRINYDPDRLTFDWLPDMWGAYGEKGLIALGFFTLSLFAQQLRGAPLWHGSIPFLEITGIPGSGKTTLIAFLHKLLGRGGANGHEGYDPNKVTGPALGRVLMRISNLPEGLIEGKRDDDKRTGKAQFDYNDLLILYDGRNPRATGQKTDGYEINEQPFFGTLYLMQNERIDAHPAVLERLVSMNIDKERFSDENRQRAQRLRELPIEDVSGTIIHVAREEANYLPFFAERYEHHSADMRRRIDGLHNDRIIKNHAQLAAAVEALPKLFPNVRSEWVAEAIACLDRLAIDRQQSIGADHPVVAEFWEKVEYLIGREPGDAHKMGKSLNCHRDPDKMMAVSLPQFESRCSQAGLRLPNMDLLKKVLRGSHSRKWVKNGPVNVLDPDYPNGKSVSCWVFQQPVRTDRIV